MGDGYIAFLSDKSLSILGRTYSHSGGKVGVYQYPFYFEGQLEGVRIALVDEESCQILIQGLIAF